MVSSGSAESIAREAVSPLARVVSLAFIIALSFIRPGVTAEKEVEKSSDGLVPLTLQLPPAAFIGTPPNDLKTNTYTEPYPDKPRAPLMVPTGLTNIARSARLSTSASNATPEMLAQIIDGQKGDTDDNIVVLRKGKQFVQIDFPQSNEIFAIAIWHGFNRYKVYYDVVVQTADDAQFTKNVRTLFNNDQDNSSGLGLGTEREYFETHEGKLIDAKGIKAQFLRFSSRGSTDGALNEYTEIEVYGRPSQ